MHKLLIIILFLVGWATMADACAEDFVVSRSVFEDKAGTLAIGDVLHANFQPQGPILAQGFTDSAYWLRINVRPRPDGGPLLLLIQPTYLDEVTLYEPDATGADASKRRVTGDQMPFSAREQVAVGLGFLVQPLQATATYYLRLKTSSASILNVQALPPHNAEIQAIRVNVLQFFFFGLILGLLFLAASDYIVSRDHVVGWFILYQMVYVLYSLALLGYLAPLLPSITSGWLNGFTNLIVCGITLVGLLFHRSVLNLFSPWRWTQRGLDLLIVLTFAILLFLALGHTRLTLQLNSMLALISAPLIFLMAFSAQREVAPGRYVVRITYSLLASMLILARLPVLDWMHTTEWSLLTFFLHGIVSSCLMFLLLYFRSRQLLNEREQAKLKFALLEQRLSKGRSELERKSHFMDMLSHELKTPLSVIRLTLGLKEISSIDRLRAKKSVQEIDIIIELCLQTAQLEQGHFRVKQQTCQLSNMMDELRAASIAPEQISLACSVLPDISSDQQLLRIVLSNLIDNAIKYGKPQSAVTIHALPVERLGQAGILITIENQPGKAGMPNAALVFTKYYRSAGAHSKTGSGLGLYLVYGLVDLLGGHITYCPSEQVVRFELWLPS